MGKWVWGRGIYWFCLRNSAANGYIIDGGFVIEISPLKGRRWGCGFRYEITHPVTQSHRESAHSGEVPHPDKSGFGMTLFQTTLLLNRFFYYYSFAKNRFISFFGFHGFHFYFGFIRYAQGKHTSRSWKISFASLQKLSDFRFSNFSATRSFNFFKFIISQNQIFPIFALLFS